MHVNTSGADWIIVRRWLNTEIEAAQSRLESPALDFTLTQFERGRLAAWRSVLDWAEPRKPPEVEDQNYG